MFYDGDIQSGIGLALQQSKAVLCFVHDDDETSAEWEAILTDAFISAAVTSQAIPLRLHAGSQEASFLTPICPINSAPAIVVIRNAQVQENLQSAEIGAQELKSRLCAAFGVQDDRNQTVVEAESLAPDQAPESTLGYLNLPPASGQMRLPNNAYDALRSHTQKLLDEGTSPSKIFQTQLTLLDNIPIFHEEVEHLRGQSPPELSENARSRLLRLPAVGLKIPGQQKSGQEPGNVVPSQSQQQSAPSVSPPASVPPSRRVPPAVPSPAPHVERPSSPSPAPPSTDEEKQKAQRAEYIRMQREREQKQRDERERIKAQIKADREERRRLDELRKQGDIDHTSSSPGSAAGTSASSRTENLNGRVRVQVRTFDGLPIHSTFPSSATLAKDIRPWIDSSTSSASNTTNIPYNLKLILTPLPNRTIEAGEEEITLSDLGIVGSCTIIMVPVRGYVDSYAGSGMGGGLLGGVGGIVSGGYNLVSGTAGFVLGGVRSLLGYGSSESADQHTPTSTSRGHTVGGGQEHQHRDQAVPAKNVRVRTLADQRAEASKKDQQFYNGNQLNFEPKKDEDGKESDKKD